MPPALSILTLYTCANPPCVRSAYRACKIGGRDFEKIKLWPTFSSTSSSKPIVGSRSSRKWCSHCKSESHNTIECRSKTLKICSYCKNCGHEEKECRKKAAASAARTTSLRKTTAKLFCRYCRGTDPEIDKCEILRKKKENEGGNPNNTGNKDVRKLQIVKVWAFQTEEEKEPEPCSVSDCNIFVKLDSPELGCFFVLQIDVGAEVSIIHYRQLPKHVILDE